MKILITLCLLFCTTCGANNNYYFCEFYIPNVPANQTAAGFDKIITIENQDFKRTLLVQSRLEPLLNHADENNTVISVYQDSKYKNYHSFRVYRFNTNENNLYTSLAIHISPEEFKRIHRSPPTKEKINELNEDPEALQYIPEKEHPSWIAYAFPRNDYHRCKSISYVGRIMRSFFMIIEAILIGG